MDVTGTAETVTEPPGAEGHSTDASLLSCGDARANAPLSHNHLPRGTHPTTRPMAAGLCQELSTGADRTWGCFAKSQSTQGLGGERQAASPPEGSLLRGLEGLGIQGRTSSTREPSPPPVSWKLRRPFNHRGPTAAEPAGRGKAALLLGCRIPTTMERWSPCLQELSVSPPHPYVEVLTPSVSEQNCIWRQGL